MAYTVMDACQHACESSSLSLCSYGLCSYDLYSYGLYSYGLCNYGLCSYGLYSYGLYDYGLYGYDCLPARLRVVIPAVMRSRSPSNEVLHATLVSPLVENIYTYGLYSYEIPPLSQN